jgi:xanthine dehydrogenase YagS FAD-binding subunit
LQCLRKGGSLCYAQEGENRFHAVFDTAPCCIVHPSNAAVALVALGATVEIVSAKETRVIAVDQLFARPQDQVTRETTLEAGEMVSAVRLEDRAWKNAYIEFRQKQTFDFPLVSCAVALRMEAGKAAEGRIVLGAVAPIPWSVPKAVEVLQGQAITEELAAKAGAQAASGARPLAQNGYKVPMIRAVVKRCLLALKE